MRGPAASTPEPSPLVGPRRELLIAAPARGRSASMTGVQPRGATIAAEIVEFSANFGKLGPSHAGGLQLSLKHDQQ